MWRVSARALTILMLSASVFATPVGAQDRDAGKEIVKGLLRALVEQQLEKEGLRGNVRPGQSPPSLQPVPGQPTAELQQLRPLSASLAQESSTLSALLNTDSRRSFEARSRLADALQFQTTAGVLRQRADAERDHRNLVAGYRSLNSDWKRLSSGLQTCPGISPQTRQCMDRINSLDAQYCRMLGIAEQLDNRELVRAADVLAADLRVLTDEVRYAAAAAVSRTRLVSSLQRLQDRSQVFAGMVADGVPRPAVVAEYQSLFRSWQQVRPELDQVQNRTVTRTASRIQDTHRTIHSLLRLDFGIDTVQLQHLTLTLRRELSELFRSITLEQMILLSDVRSITTSADTVSGTAENLIDVIERHEDRQVVGEAWVFLEEAWHLFDYYIATVQQPDVRRRAEGISQTIESLGGAIGVTVSYDPRAVAQQAATLHHTADLLQVSVRQWQARPGHGSQPLRRDVDLLETKCRELENLAASPRNRDVSHVKCDEVLGLWQQVRPKLLECTTEEREAIARAVESFTPELVRLHTMLGD